MPGLSFTGTLWEYKTPSLEAELGHRSIEQSKNILTRFTKSSKKLRLASFLSNQVRTWSRALKP